MQFVCQHPLHVVFVGPRLCHDFLVVWLSGNAFVAISVKSLYVGPGPYLVDRVPVQFTC